MGSRSISEIRRSTSGSLVVDGEAFPSALQIDPVSLAALGEYRQRSAKWPVVRRHATTVGRKVALSH